MNSLERILAAVHNKPVDQTPVIPVMLMQGAREVGLSLPDYYRQANRMAEGQLRLLEKFDHDAVFAIPHIVQDVLPWGGDLQYHQTGPPTMSKLAVPSWEAIDGLRCPDPTAHPVLRGTLNAAGELARKVKGQRLIVGAVIGPFSLPTMLLGMRKFMSLLLNDEGRARWLPKMLELTTQYSARWAQAQLDAGCDLVVIAEGAASAGVSEPAIFRDYAKPAMEKMVKQVKGLTALEFVGHGLPYLPQVKDLPYVAYLIGETEPPAEVRRVLGPGRAVLGNLNNLKLLRWNPERVEFEARRVIAQAGPGFILGNQGPEIGWDVPEEAVHALVRAARSTTWQTFLAA